MNKDYRILCVDDDEDFLVHMKSMLSNYNVVTSTSLKRVLNPETLRDIDTVLLDIDMKGESGMDGLKSIKDMDASINIVMVTGHREPEMIVEAIKAGASDYICKPITKDDLSVCIEKAKKSRLDKEKINALMSELNSVDVSSRIIGRSRALSELLEKAKKVKGYHDAHVLIEGESGTGKELLARYVHRLEENSHRPFVVVNCAAIPENLIESEFFGHEKGSFTGAICKKIGKLTLADNGDLFLDEINTLKPELQAKLLRAIQEKEFCPVGGNEPITSNFRVIAATNENLDKLVQEGKFRLDLYHRLKIVQLHMSPLRERKDDIPVLIDHFLNKFSKKGSVKKISKGAMDKLLNNNWPGNVRELENIVHSAVILSQGDMIDGDDLPLSKRSTTKQEDQNMLLKDYINSAEKNYIQSVLDNLNGNREKAADHLGISRATLYNKMKTLGLE
ncbi:MAG: sigma-54 dependent transcriptional regulator [Pseudomonadota bacterium]